MTILAEAKDSRVNWIIPFLRQEWNDLPSHHLIAVTLFKIYKIGSDTLQYKPIVQDIGEYRIVILNGELKNIPIREHSLERDEGIPTHRGDVKDLQQGNYLLFLRHREDPGLRILDGETISPEEHGQLWEIEGHKDNNLRMLIHLCRAINGKNCAFEKLAHFHISTNREMGIFHSDTKVEDLTSPRWHRKPDFSEETFGLISQTYAMILSLEESKKIKIAQSLRWFNEGILEAYPDAFLKIWIALEMLTETPKREVPEIIAILAKAYNKTPDEIGRKYRIGKLSEIRNKIVHEGFSRYIFPAAPQFYLAALYIDMLFEVLGLDCPKRVETLSQEGSTVDDFLDGIDHIHKQALGIV